MYSSRVYIVPLRDDPDHATDSVLANRADRVHLLPDTHDCDTADRDASAERLSEHDVAVETYAVDHMDMYAVLGPATTLASRPEHDGDEVFINVSTGSRVAALGAALGCIDVLTDALCSYGCRVCIWTQYWPQ